MFLVLFKINDYKNGIYEITEKYCDLNKNLCDYYFLICDQTIAEDFEIYGNLLKIKIIEDNWNSLLVKVVIGMKLFKDTKSYTHVIVSNISTILNLPAIHERIKQFPTNFVSANIGKNYAFKNYTYDFPSGAGYILSIGVVNVICDFFDTNKYIKNYKLTEEFCSLYPSTDDIFIGFLIKDKYKIVESKRLDYPFTISDDIKLIEMFRFKPFIPDKYAVLCNVLYKSVI